LSESVAAPQEPVGGWHFAEWLSELIGTALLVFAAMSCVVLVFSTDSPFADQSMSLRLLLLGLMFTVIIFVIAVSPIGRLSGAHINPAVTLAFKITGHVHRHDLIGYWVAQLAGGVAGAYLVKLWGSAAESVEWGVIRPSVSTPAAIGIEALMVGAIVLTMFLVLSSERTVRWTPLAAGLVVALATWKGAPHTGTGLNPARTLGPQVVAADFSSWWVYWAGAALGATVVAVVWKLGPRVALTAKLFHDPSYRSVFRSHLPVLHPRGR
jgi:aquaporin Z